MQRQSTIQTSSILKSIYAKEYRLRKARYVVPKQELTKRPNLVRDLEISKRKTSSRDIRTQQKTTAQRISPSAHRTVSKCIARNLNSIIRSEKRLVDKSRRVRRSKEKTREVQTLRETRLEDRREFHEKLTYRKLRKYDDVQRYKLNVGNQLCEFDTKVMLDIEHKHTKNRAANIRHRLVKDQNFLEEVRVIYLFFLALYPQLHQTITNNKQKFSLRHGGSQLGRRSPTAWSICSARNDDELNNNDNTRI